MSSNLFGNMKTEGLESAEDRLGGFQILDTDIYTGTVKALYAGESKGGAMSVTVVVGLDGPGGSKEYKETVYVSNKKKENFFVDEKTKKKMPLPGFTTVNDLCLIAMEKELKDVETEEKVVKIYDYEAKKEVPTNVQMITEAIGKKVSLGILKVVEYKQKKGDDGEYHDTDETREVNQIDKVFHPEAKVTVVEARSGKKEGGFWDSWLKRHQGQTRDKTKNKTGSGGTASGSKGGSNDTGAPKAGGTGSVPKKSLFGK